MKDQKKDIPNYDPLYGKIMGMSNAGFEDHQIADALKIPRWRVTEVRQIAYGRSLMLKELKNKNRRDS